MALKKVKTEATGKSRWFRREEVKRASKKLRRRADKESVA